MAEDDRVGNLHHGCLHVEGEQDVLLNGFVELFGEEGAERVAVHYRSIDYFAFQKHEFVLQNSAFTGRIDEFDMH